MKTLIQHSREKIHIVMRTESHLQAQQEVDIIINGKNVQERTHQESIGTGFDRFNSKVRGTAE